MIRPLEMSTEDILNTLQMNILSVINRNKEVDDPLYQQSLQIFKDVCQNKNILKIPSLTSSLFFGGEKNKDKTKILKEAAEMIAQKLNLTLNDEDGEEFTQNDICIQNINSQSNTDFSKFKNAAAVIVIYEMTAKEDQAKLLELISNSSGNNVFLNVQADESDIDINHSLATQLVFIKVSPQEILANKIKLMRERENDSDPSLMLF